MMPKLLTKLKITEVSAVDRAANEGAKILIMTRADHRSRVQQIFDAALKKVAPEVEDAAATPTTNAASDRISSLADLVVEGTGGAIDRAAAIGWLLHTAAGQSLVLRTSKNHQTNSNEKEQPVLIQTVLKQYGLISVAKSMINEQISFGLSEHEFTALIADYAKTTKRADESDAAAFEREFTSNEILRKAYAVVKDAQLASLQATQVGANAALATDPDFSAAMLQLQNMAEKLRQEAPYLSVSQAFSRVFQDPQNSQLAAKAHRRPAPTTNFAFPR